MDFDVEKIKKYINKSSIDKLINEILKIMTIQNLIFEMVATTTGLESSTFILLRGKFIITFALIYDKNLFDDIRQNGIIKITIDYENTSKKIVCIVINDKMHSYMILNENNCTINYSNQTKFFKKIKLQIFFSPNQNWVH